MFGRTGKGVEIGLICLGLSLAWASTGRAQAQTAAGGGGLTLQPMLVPMMAANGQSVNSADPFLALSNPLYGANGAGLTNQQLGLLMLTMPARNGGLGSGRLSGVRPDPLAPKMTPGRKQALAAAERDRSPVRRATRPAGTGTASRYFSRRSPTQASEPRGFFDRQARYFP